MFYKLSRVRKQGNKTNKQNISVSIYIKANRYANKIIHECPPKFTLVIYAKLINLFFIKQIKGTYYFFNFYGP